jgi:hypothetical protein
VDGSASIAAGYIRKNHEVEAVQVSYERLQTVSDWCGGHIGTSRETRVGEIYIRVPVFRSKNKPNRAYVGDWIVRDGDGLKIFSDKSFTATYKPIVPDPEKFEKVLKLVKYAMLEQDSATYHGRSANMSEIAEAVTQGIMGIF